MFTPSLHHRVFTFAISVTLLAFSGWASADPPSRVGRLGYMTGEVSFSPAGESDWVRASMNRPLTTGDRLWTETRARTEIQIGGAMVRMNADTSVSILNLDNRIVQLQLTQGTLNVRVRRLASNQVFEVNTPNLAFTMRQAGEYRITVDSDGNATTIFVRKGKGEAYGEGAAYVLDSRQSYRFTGTGLRDYRYVNAPGLDEFDRWSSERDRRYDKSGSARYVSQDVIGYQDLDANGIWRVDATYGNVWQPNRVSSGWAPYRDGHWAWVDPWGWTWIDDAPWGFAVSHYGRWANLRGTWVWVPGPVRTQAYYAPALVVFVGDRNFQLTLSSGNVGAVGWFPLGPREVYQPSYAVSRSYFENVNISNTVVNTTVINNYYNNSNVTNVVYANRQVAGAIIAVPTTTFVQSQSVSKAAVRVTREMVASAPLATVAAVVPTLKSVRGDAALGNKPPAQVFDRAVVARTAPPAAHPSFAEQQQQLNAKPGKPLDEAARKDMKPAAAAPAPAVKVVAPTQTATPPTVRPPPVTSETSPADTRGKPEQRDNKQQPVQPAQPAEQAKPVLPAPPGKPAAPPQRAAEPKAVAPPTAQPAPATPSAPAAPAASRAKPDEQRGKPETRDKPVQRDQPAAPASKVTPPTQRATEPKAVTPPVVAPAPVAPPAPATPQAARPERKAPPAAKQVEPQPPAKTPAPPAVRQPAPPQAAQPAPNVDTGAQPIKPKPSADKDKSKAKDKAKTAEELLLEEEELLRKRRSQNK